MINKIAYTEANTEAFYVYNGISVLKQNLSLPLSLDCLYYSLHLLANVVFEGGKIRDEMIEACHAIVLEIERKAMEEQRDIFLEVIALYYGILINSQPPLSIDFVRGMIPKLLKFLQSSNESVIIATMTSLANYIDQCSDTSLNILNESIEILTYAWNRFQQLQPLQLDDFKRIQFEFLKIFNACAFLPQETPFYEYVINSHIVDWLICTSYNDDNDDIKSMSLSILSNIIVVPDSVPYAMCTVINRTNIIESIIKTCSFNHITRVTENSQCVFIAFFLLCDDIERKKYFQNDDFYRAIKHMLLLSNITSKMRFQVVIALKLMVKVLMVSGISVSMVLEQSGLYQIISDMSVNKHLTAKIKQNCNEILKACDLYNDDDDMEMD